MGRAGFGSFQVVSAGFGSFRFLVITPRKVAKLQKKTIYFYLPVCVTYPRHCLGFFLLGGWKSNWEVDLKKFSEPRSSEKIFSGLEWGSGGCSP